MVMMMVMMITMRHLPLVLCRHSKLRWLLLVCRQFGSRRILHCAGLMPRRILRLMRGARARFGPRAASASINLENNTEIQSHKALELHATNATGRLGACIALARRTNKQKCTLTFFTRLITHRALVGAYRARIHWLAL